MVGVSPQYWHDLEHGRRRPSEAVLRRIAHVLKTSDDYLLLLAGYWPSDLRRKVQHALPEVVLDAVQAFQGRIPGSVLAAAECREA